MSSRGGWFLGYLLVSSVALMMLAIVNIGTFFSEYSFGSLLAGSFALTVGLWHIGLAGRIFWKEMMEND